MTCSKKTLWSLFNLLDEAATQAYKNFSAFCFGSTLFFQFAVGAEWIWTLPWGTSDLQNKETRFQLLSIYESSILVVSRQKSDALEISHIPDNVMSFLNFLERLNYLFSKTVSPLNVSHIDSVLPYVCWVINYRWRQNAVRTKKWPKRRSRVRHWASYHIMTFSVIFYCTDPRQHLFVSCNKEPKHYWWWRHQCVCAPIDHMKEPTKTCA